MFRSFYKIKKNIRDYMIRGGRGDTMQKREGKREGGEREPKGREDQEKVGSEEYTVYIN